MRKRLKKRLRGQARSRLVRSMVLALPGVPEWHAEAWVTVNGPLDPRQWNDWASMWEYDFTSRHQSDFRVLHEGKWVLSKQIGNQ